MNLFLKFLNLNSLVFPSIDIETFLQVGYPIIDYGLILLKAFIKTRWIQKSCEFFQFNNNDEVPKGAFLKMC
jgi:hypothetical protein